MRSSLPFDARGRSRGRGTPSLTTSRSASTFSTPSALRGSRTSTGISKPQRSRSALSTTGSVISRSTISRAVSSRPETRTSGRPTTASGRKSRASFLGQNESHNIICAVSEGRGVSPSVGLAFVNVSLGEVTLSQMCDTQSYVKTIHKLQMAAPSRIVFMTTACPPSKASTLYSLVDQMISDAQLAAFDRSAWSETAGLQYIKQLAFEGDVEPLEVAIQGKFYATTSLAAAMKYIEQTFSVDFAIHSLRIRYQPPEDTMMIDISAIQTLEIMQNQRDHKSKDCLFGLLNHTLTPMGSRMLRNNVLQPPTEHEKFILPRYDALEELTAHEDMFRALRKVLKQIFDVEKLLTKLITIPKVADVSQVEEQLNQVLMIKSFLESVPELWRALSPAHSALLIKIRSLCTPDITVPILSLIRTVIQPDVTYTKSPLDRRNQRTFAVQPGISGMLDVSRQTYKELTKEIHQHVASINEQYGFNAILRFDNGRKYWLRMKSLDYDHNAAKDSLINVLKKKGNVECQTLVLVKLNLRLSDASNEVVIRSDAVIQDLMKELRREAQQLFRICESVALVDMMCSFAQLVTTRDYARPVIASTLALKFARHPLLDKILADEFVPNDYYATEENCFHIITGCNMSGKSIYIRTIALLQIMAQVGCFVPAEYAAFPIIHNIFARISLNDNLEANLSTFSVEMREMAFILRHIDGKSLAIIDELGRGTSPQDGMAIAIAMSEALIQSKASVWFATHFIELAQVLADRPGVYNLHLSVQSTQADNERPRLTMLYKAMPGHMDNMGHYGISLARAMGFPEAFTTAAEKIARELRQKRQLVQQSSGSRRLLERRKLILNLHDTLLQASESADEATLPEYLQRLQEQFIARMEEVDNM